MHFGFDAAAKLSPAVPVAFGVSEGEVPIRLVIGGIDLLCEELSANSSDSCKGLPLNLIEVATYGHWCFRQSQKWGRSAFPLDETGEALLFLMDDADVLVHSTIVEKTVRIPFSRLDDAWSDFATKVWSELTRRFPQLASLDDWEIATRGPQDEQFVEQPALWEREFRGHEGCFGTMHGEE